MTASKLEESIWVSRLDNYLFLSINPLSNKLQKASVYIPLLIRNGNHNIVVSDNITKIQYIIIEQCIKIIISYSDREQQILEYDYLGHCIRMQVIIHSIVI